MIVGEDPNDSDDRVEKNASDIPDYQWNPVDEPLASNDYLENMLRNDYPISDYCRWLLDYGGFEAEQVYLTNQKKCSNIGGGQDSKRDEARHNCQQYLEQEVDFLEPEIVLLSGEKAIKGANEVFNLSLSTSPSSDAGDRERNNGQIFVTSPNFGYAEANLKRPACPYEGPEEFFTEIGTLFS